MIRALSTACAVTGALFFTGVSFDARADAGPFSEVRQLVQDGEGIDVHLALLEAPYVVSLERHAQDEDVVLLAEHAFSEDEITNVKEECYGNPGQDCSEDPGVCLHGCYTYYHVWYFDECVLPGFTIYFVDDWHSEDIDVGDVGQDCSEFPPGGVDGGVDWEAEAWLVDAGAEGYDDHGDMCELPPGPQPSDSDCSVSGVGGDAGIGAATGAILMLLGIVALARGRRRNQ